MTIGKSSVDGSTAVYGIYSDHACKNKVAEITIGEDGMGSVKLKSVRRTAAGKRFLCTQACKRKPVLRKTILCLIIVRLCRPFRHQANWEAIVGGDSPPVFGDDADERLLVYDVRNAGTACDYTISEVNVDNRYNIPKAQNVSLANGRVDLTVTAAFVNELKTGGLKINKQSEDGAEPALVRCRLIRCAQAVAEVFLLPLARSA